MRYFCANFVFLSLHMDYFKVQQNCLQEKLNIYYFDYTKYFCDNWKSVKMKKMQRKISSLTVSSRAVVEAKKKSFFFFIFQH